MKRFPCIGMFLLVASLFGACSPSRSTESTADPVDTVTSHAEMTTSIQPLLLVSANSSHAFVDRGGKGVELYDIPSKDIVFELFSKEGLRAYALSAGGNTLAMLLEEGQVDLFVDGKLHQKVLSVGPAAQAICPSEDGRRVAVLKMENGKHRIEIIEVSDQRSLAAFDIEPLPRKVSFWGSPDLQQIALHSVQDMPSESMICRWSIDFQSGKASLEKCHSSWNKPLLGTDWVFEVVGNEIAGVKVDGTQARFASYGGETLLFDPSWERLLAYRLSSLDGPSGAILHFRVFDLHSLKETHNKDILSQQYNNKSYLLASLVTADAIPADVYELKINDTDPLTLFPLVLNP